ncbi:hypothetical protein SynMITS9220_01268 [Synechococcus sp. MIT S9220]|nr:hypothetical protein SynMITS9220_01268 [Synechococcus sp. MIT S9220]
MTTQLASNRGHQAPVFLRLFEAFKDSAASRSIANQTCVNHDQPEAT